MAQTIKQITTMPAITIPAMPPTINNDDGMKTIVIMKMIVILVLSGYVSISSDTFVSVDICDDHLGS